MNRIIRAAVAALLLAVVVTAPATAASGRQYATWSALSGSSTNYHGTVQLGGGFPATAYTTSSRSGQVGPQSGTSAWLPAWTPVGQTYGSSQGRPYLNLRPKADSASAPSHTTYTFERSTPLGWAFVLGDIDSDAVTISATKADGTAATAAELGFQGVFNYCSRTPRPSSCAGTHTDQPRWDAQRLTLSGNPDARDTSGASGWFQPTVPLRTLTLTFTRRAGFPVFQTWFAVRTQALSGTVAVTSGTCDVAGLEVTLRDAAGQRIATTTTNAAGAYSFERVAAGPGYRVDVGKIPSSCRHDGPPSRTGIDLRSGDATADFAVRELVPAAIEGRVVDEAGAPISGVEVSLTPDGSAPVRATTDADGRYVFDGNAIGEYDLTISTPEGYRRTSGDLHPVVTEPDQVISDQDFVLAAHPDVSGRVHAGDEPVAGATVELRDPDGTVVARAVTDEQGAYRFDRVAPDREYTIAVPEPPDDYGAPTPRTVAVGQQDSPGNDFALTRRGSIGGTVRDGDGPVASVRVTVTGPDGFRRVLDTDAAGRYGVEGLPAGTYTITIEPPDGTTADRRTRTVTITTAGESLGTEDFVLRAVPGDDSHAGSGAPGPGGSGTAASRPPVLPDAGGPSRWWTVLGLLCVVAGALLLRGSVGNSDSSGVTIDSGRFYPQ